MGVNRIGGVTAQVWFSLQNSPPHLDIDRLGSLLTM